MFGEQHGSAGEIVLAEFSHGLVLVGGTETNFTTEYTESTKVTTALLVLMASSTFGLQCGLDIIRSSNEVTSLDGVSNRSMKTDNIPHFLAARTQENLVVEFVDGDRYFASALDLVGPFEEDEFEIRVEFKDCIGKSQARIRAFEAGIKRSPPGCWWTSTSPQEPVAMTYSLEQIAAIHSDDDGFSYYQRSV